jgi:hypothetical protein
VTKNEEVFWGEPEEGAGGDFTERERRKLLTRGLGRLAFGGLGFGRKLVEADDDGAEVEGALARDGEMGDEAVGSFVRVLDEAGAAEFGEVFGGVDAGDADAAGDFFDREGIAVEEFVEDAPTDGVGDGGEEAIEGAVGSWAESGGGWHGRLGAG